MVQREGLEGSDMKKIVFKNGVELVVSRPATGGLALDFTVPEAHVQKLLAEVQRWKAMVHATPAGFMLATLLQAVEKVQTAAREVFETKPQ